MPSQVDIDALLFVTMPGNALGDAVGLCTEFLDKEQSVARFGTKVPFPVPDSKKTPHSAHWTDG